MERAPHLYTKDRETGKMVGIYTRVDARGYVVTAAAAIFHSHSLFSLRFQLSLYSSLRIFPIVLSEISHS